MTICNPRDLINSLAPGKRILGLELGTKTIGLALTDVGHCIATPMETIKRTKQLADFARLMDIIETQGVGALVLGLPINMDDTEGKRCQATRQFASDFLKGIDIPLAFWDERLSSSVAQDALIEANVRPKKRKAVIDKIAASVILQGFLDNIGARN